MFTGLVEEVGVVQRLEHWGEGGRLSVQARAVLEGTRLGDSIAVNGTCLTVVDVAGDGFTVDCMPETLQRSTLGAASRGTRVNLERSLALGQRLGGHLVLGHVDAVAEVLSTRRNGEAGEIRFALPQEIAACVAAKGSIAIDGISLTVIRTGPGWFEVGIIPHTMAETTLSDLKTGTRVNLEADVLARYVQRALSVQTRGPDPGEGEPGGLTEEALRRLGFA